MPLPRPTSRLRFRWFTPADGPQVTAVVTDPAVTAFIRPQPMTADDAVQVVLPEMLERYATTPGYGRIAVERHDGTFLGWVSVMPRVPGDRPIIEWPAGDVGAPVVEIGYRLLPTAWGQGFATEAATSVISYAAEELGAQRLVATTMAVNVRSRKVLERLGFRLVRVVVAEWDEEIPGAEQGEAEYELDSAPPLRDE